MDLEFGVNMNRPFLKEYYSITPAELDVLSRLGRGISNQEIANELCVAEKTVKYHLTHIYKKLGVKSRMETVMMLSKIV